MGRLEKVTKYFIMLGATIFLLFILNYVLIYIVSEKTGNGMAYVSAEGISEYLCVNDDGQYVITEEGKKEIDSYKGFAMLLGDSGEVMWEYNLPDELPREYTRKDIASFTRWYLQDYPVYVHIREDGIFVVGRPKHTVWKYNMIFSVQTIQIFLQYVPIILLFDLSILILVPALLLRRDLHKKEQMRTTWIAGISHDIRTPLALVIGDAEQIRQGCEKTEPELAGRAKRIQDQVIRIRTLITNLNTDNKLNYGMGKWKREEIAFCALLREVICEMLNREPGEQYEFDVQIDDDAEDCMVKGDRELIKRMIENLIANSIRHNPEGCNITIAFHKNKKLSIADNGHGVSKQQLRNFRKPLFMEQLGEHGLGIRLVRRIAKVHHWHVQFKQNGSSGLCCLIDMRSPRDFLIDKNR